MKYSYSIFVVLFWSPIVTVFGKGAATPVPYDGIPSTGTPGTTTDVPTCVSSRGLAAAMENGCSSILDPAYICSNAQIAHDFASYITSLFPENDQQALELQKVVCGTRSATVGAASVSSTPESAIEPFLAPIDASPSFTSASLSSGGVVLSSGSGNAALGLRDSTPVGSGSDTGLSWPFFVLGCILVILGVGVQVGGMVL